MIILGMTRTSKPGSVYAQYTVRLDTTFAFIDIVREGLVADGPLPVEEGRSGGGISTTHLDEAGDYAMKMFKPSKKQMCEMGFEPTW